MIRFSFHIPLESSIHVVVYYRVKTRSQLFKSMLSQSKLHRPESIQRNDNSCPNQKTPRNMKNLKCWWPMKDLMCPARYILSRFFAISYVDRPPRDHFGPHQATTLRPMPLPQRKRLRVPVPLRRASLPQLPPSVATELALAAARPSRVS